jgi:foldase protein PrsA
VVVAEEVVVVNDKPRTTSNLRRNLLLLLLALLVVHFWYRTNTWPIVAFVNNKPVSRFQLDQALYKQGGQQVLDSIITQKLVDEELEKNKVTASSAEVDSRIEEIKNSLGSSFDVALSAQGLTMEQLREQVAVQIRIEKLLDSQATGSAEEISQMMKDGNMDASTAAKAVKQQKLQTVIQDWVDGLRTKAKIIIVGKK